MSYTLNQVTDNLQLQQLTDSIEREAKQALQRAGKTVRLAATWQLDSEWLARHELGTATSNLLVVFDDRWAIQASYAVVTAAATRAVADVPGDATVTVPPLTENFIARSPAEVEALKNLLPGVLSFW